ncbi:MAG: OmpA family protein [Thermoflexibacter sp.]|nr:OmpA family protein [Thermoflexibacter sp.]
MIKPKFSFLLYLVVFALIFFQQAWGQEYKIEHNLQGNKGEVQNIRFSPDGKLLAGGEQFGNIIIWNVKTGKLEKIITGHSKRVLEVTFNKSGSMLASTSEDGTVAVWDTKTWRLLATFRNKPFISFDGRELISSSFVVFSPDNKFVYFGGDNGYVMKGQIAPEGGVIRPAEEVVSTNYEDGRWYGTITGGCISGDEKYLVITVGHLVDFIDLKADILAKYFRYDEGYLNDVVVGPQGNMLATWSDDGKINVWNSATGQIAKSFQVTVPGNYSGASFSKDGKYLISSASGIVAKLWDVNSGSQLSTLTGHSRIVRISRFSPTENIIATASYDGTVNIWKEKKEDDVPIAKEDTKKEEPKKEEPKKEEPVVIVKNPTVKEEKKDVLKDIKIEEVHEGDIIQLENILFRQSKPDLLPSSYDELKKLLSFMKKYPTIQIELSGHTDNVGNPAKNLQLSEQRVVVVKTYLIRQGIKDTRIKTVAYGGDRPLADNTTEEGRQKNRRVEMKILKK